MIFDLIAGMNAAAAASTWTPAELFQNGERGYWFDGSDYTTMSQDVGIGNILGVTPVTGAGQPVGVWANKIVGQVAVFNIVQVAASAKPITTLTSGKYAVRYDGVDDQLSANNVPMSPTVGAFTLAIGQKRSVNSADDIIILDNAISLSNRGDGLVDATVLGRPIRSTNTLSLTQGNVIVSGGDMNTEGFIRVNGVLTNGVIPGTTPPNSIRTKIVGESVNGCDISQAVFIDRVLTTTEITQLEAFIGSKQ